MKCLVTGASGFLGGAVARAAFQAGHDVVALGRAAAPPADFRGEYRRVDFGSAPDLVAALRQVAPDCVLHFAGTASVGDSFTDPFRDFEDSTLLWYRLLDAIRTSGRRPLVALASSAAVYGSPEELPTPETAARRPESPYGFHKLLAEQAGEEFARCFDLDIVALRFFSVFGPRQRRLLVGEIFAQLRAGGPELRLKGTGDERRDFLAEDEAAAATLDVVCALGARPRSDGFRAINIASGASASVREVAEGLRAGMGSAARIVFKGQARPGNPDRWQADVRALKQLVPDFTPRPLAKSLAKFLSAWDVPTPAPAQPSRNVSFVNPE